MRITLTAVLILAMAGAANAAVSYQVLDVAISAAAQDPVGPPAGDAALIGAGCYDIAITSDGDLIGCQLTVTQGNVYNHFAGSDAPPMAALFPSFPALEFDSYVDMPTTPPTILAGTLASGTTIDYGDLADNGAQTGAVVARITLTDPGTGLATLTVTENVGGAPVQTRWVDIVLPEPATMSLLAMGGLAVLRRRR